MTDDDLRRAYQARVNRAGGPPPTPEELAALVSGSGTEAERLEILDRALAHPETARELELLRAITAAERAEAPSRAARWRVPLALAATVTLAVSATLLVLSRRQSEILRAPPALGAPAPITPEDAAVRAPGNITFVWHPVPKAGGYRFELLTEVGALVTATTTPDTSTAVGVAGTGPYRWVVVALLPDGVEVLSRPRSLRITP